MAIKLYAPEDLSEHLGIPVKTLARWRHVGTGPKFVRVGKHVRYRPADVEAWLDACQRNAA